MAERVRVGRFEDLPDDTGKVVEIGGEEIALFKVGDQAYAIENMCPHREGPLGDGELEDGIVTCPWHAWQINVRSGEVEYDPSICARTFRCTIEAGDVWVELPATG